jgi:hypothetical protein
MDLSRVENLPRRVSRTSSEVEPGKHPEMTTATTLKKENIGNAKVNNKWKENLL